LSSLWIFFFIFPISYHIFDLYYPFKKFKSPKMVVDVILGGALGVLAYGFICFMLNRFFLPRMFFFYFIGQILISAIVTRCIYDIIFQGRFLDKKTVILGTGPIASEIHDLIDTTYCSGMDVIGYIAEDDDVGKRKAKGKGILGHVGQLVSLLDWYNVDLLVLACEENNKASEFEVMRFLIGRKIQMVSAVHLFERLSGSIPYKVIDPKFILSLASDVRTKHYLHLKRLLDITFSASLLILTLPILALSIFLLSFQGIDKIFFVQKRIGKDGKRFSIYKLRSMSAVKGRSPKVTSFGRILRKFRIDELPQFLNVLKGDMSLIGPRPETDYFVKHCRRKISHYDIVFSVRPGISGWAQVNLGHVSDFKDYPKKFCFNVYYLKNISLDLDLQIFLKTIRSILLGTGK